MTNELKRLSIPREPSTVAEMLAQECVRTAREVWTMEDLDRSVRERA